LKISKKRYWAVSPMSLTSNVPVPAVPSSCSVSNPAWATTLPLMTLVGASVSVSSPSSRRMAFPPAPPVSVPPLKIDAPPVVVVAPIATPPATMLPLLVTKTSPVPMFWARMPLPNDTSTVPLTVTRLSPLEVPLVETSSPPSSVHMLDTVMSRSPAVPFDCAMMPTSERCVALPIWPPLMSTTTPPVALLTSSMPTLVLLICPPDMLTVTRPVPWPTAWMPRAPLNVPDELMTVAPAVAVSMPNVASVVSAPAKFTVMSPLVESASNAFRFEMIVPSRVASMLPVSVIIDAPPPPPVPIAVLMRLAAVCTNLAPAAARMLTPDPSFATMLPATVASALPRPSKRTNAVPVPLLMTEPAPT
jgi:hypothetical protein